MAKKYPFGLKRNEVALLRKLHKKLEQWRKEDIKILQQMYWYESRQQDIEYTLEREKKIKSIEFELKCLYGLVKKPKVIYNSLIENKKEEVKIEEKQEDNVFNFSIDEDLNFMNFCDFDSLEFSSF